MLKPMVATAVVKLTDSWILLSENLASVLIWSYWYWNRGEGEDQDAGSKTVTPLFYCAIVIILKKESV